jgi:hypothetical protein
LIKDILLLMPAFPAHQHRGNFEARRFVQHRGFRLIANYQRNPNSGMGFEKTNEVFGIGAPAACPNG